MTEQEWKRRCVNRIYRKVKTAGHVRVRDLKRATNYNRGPEEAGIAIWYEALEYLERLKHVAVKRDYEGFEVSVALPDVATALGWQRTPKTNHFM
jgi:hypothetical protein